MSRLFIVQDGVLKNPMITKLTATAGVQEACREVGARGVHFAGLPRDGIMHLSARKDIEPEIVNAVGQCFVAKMQARYAKSDEVPTADVKSDAVPSADAKPNLRLV